jgi:O-antigen ligase
VRDQLHAPVENPETGTPATRLLGRVVFYGLLVLTLLTAIPYGTVQPWSEAIFQCVVFTLALLFIVEGYLSGSWHVPGAMLLFPAVALIVLALLQSVPLWPANVAAAGSGRVWLAISADPFESRRFALKMAAFLIAGGLMMRYLNRRRRLHALIAVVLGVAVASSIFGILRQGLQRPKQDFVLPYLDFNIGYAQFINKNHFAFLVEMALGLALGLILARTVRRDRLLIYGAVLLVLWTALVLSNSRGGVLAMIGQMVLALIVFIRHRTAEGTGASKTKSRSVWRFARSWVVQIVLVLALVFVVIVGVVWVGGDPLLSNVEQASTELHAQPSEYHEGARRRDIWWATWQMIKDNPIAGVGLGGYWTAVPLYHDGSGKLTPQQAHNDYLELLASGGIIGAVIGIWFLLVWGRKVRGAIRSDDAAFRAAAWGAIIAVAGVAIHCLFDFGLHKTINALIFMWLLAIIAAAGQRSEVRGQRSEFLPRTLDS